MRFSSLAALPLWAALLLVSAGASAQDKVQSGTTTLRLDAVDVSQAPQGKLVLYASFLDKYFKPIAVTEPAKWTVNLDGEPIEGELDVTLLGSSERGVSAVIVYPEVLIFQDAWFEPLRKGISDALNKLRPSDRSALVAYGKTVESSGNLTPGHNEAIGWLSERKSEGVIPLLYAAVDKGLDLFPPDFDTVGPNRVMLVVTDGFDELDQSPDELKDKLDSLKSKARDRNVRLDVVGVAIDDDSGLARVRKLAHYTKGTYREARTPGKLDLQLNDFASELTGQHVLTMQTSDFEGGKDTTFQVGVEQGGQQYNSGNYIVFLPEQESHLLKWAAIGAGGLLVLGLLFFVVKKIAELARNRDDDVEVEAGPELVRCTGGCNNMIPLDWKVCKYCEALPHMGRLKVVSGGDLNGHTWFIRESLTNIGSDDGNNVVVPDRSVSARHAGIKVQDNRFELADFGSTNGVLVNGQRITKQFLKAGDKISIGAVEMEFSLK